MDDEIKELMEDYGVDSSFGGQGGDRLSGCGRSWNRKA